MQDVGCRVQGVRFRVWSVGGGLQGVGFGFRQPHSRLGLRFPGLDFWVSGFRIGLLVAAMTTTIPNPETGAQVSVARKHTRVSGKHTRVSRKRTRVS